MAEEATADVGLRPPSEPSYFEIADLFEWIESAFSDYEGFSYLLIKLDVDSTFALFV